MEKFGSIDLLVTNAGYSPPSLYRVTTENFNALVSTNLWASLHCPACRDTNAQQGSGAVVSITAALPINRSRSERGGSDDHQGRAERGDQELGHRGCKGRDQIQRGSPGIVEPPMHKGRSEDFSGRCSRWRVAHVNDVLTRLVPRAQRRQGRGEVLHVDGGFARVDGIVKRITRRSVLASAGALVAGCCWPSTSLLCQSGSTTTTTLDKRSLCVVLALHLDWGARTANISAALWPERCKRGFVSGALSRFARARRPPHQARERAYYSRYFENVKSCAFWRHRH